MMKSSMGDDGGEASDYNAIKDAVHSKLRY